MATSQDLMGVLGTIFIVIIILSLVGSMDSRKKHTTLVAPTRTIVQLPDVVDVTRWGPRYPGHHNRHPSRNPPRRPHRHPPHHKKHLLGPGGIQKR